jgi:hypothetical protein
LPDNRTRCTAADMMDQGILRTQISWTAGDHEKSDVPEGSGSDKDSVRAPGAKIGFTSGRRPAGLCGKLLVRPFPCPCHRAIRSSPKLESPSSYPVSPFVPSRHQTWLRPIFEGGRVTALAVNRNPLLQNAPYRRKEHPDTAMFSGSVSHCFFYNPPLLDTFFFLSVCSLLYVCGLAPLP